VSKSRKVNGVTISASSLEVFLLGLIIGSFSFREALGAVSGGQGVTGADIRVSYHVIQSSCS
jgi:hypothetical protein